MTDKELIQALRDEGITDIGDMMDYMEDAADRLEALLAENDHLREVTKMMPRWVSVKEKLPPIPPDYVDEDGKTWFTVSDRFLAVVGTGNRVCEVSYIYQSRGFTYRGNPISVSYWANFPNRPAPRGWSDESPCSL